MNPHSRQGSCMGSFGEDLRMERLARGIALEDITAITKISRQHLLALEQERFRLLPGGILSKGIVRGYAGVLGLNEDDWMKRFVQASHAHGCSVEDDSGWEAFASNVGKSRMQKRDAAELRLRWVGAMLLALALAFCLFLLIRSLGNRSGWWSSLIPSNGFTRAVHSVYESVIALFDRFLN